MHRDEFAMPRKLRATPRSLSLVIVLFSSATSCPGTLAAEPLRIYGPGGPLPAIKEAAAAFERTQGVTIDITSVPTPQWINGAISGETCLPYRQVAKK